MADLRTPPGRAGRMRLRHSLEVARRGADLLDQKLRILRARHEELSRAEHTSRDHWHERLREAETWLLRGLRLGGEETPDAPHPERPAELEIAWTSTMGVRHPRAASCTVPEREPDAPAQGAGDRPAPFRGAAVAADAGPQTGAARESDTLPLVPAGSLPTFNPCCGAAAGAERPTHGANRSNTTATKGC